MQIIVIMPVYDDWDSAMQVCRKIDLVFQESPSESIEVLLVDDGSAGCAHPYELPFRPAVIKTVSILTLRRNLGHQRAIAIALANIQQNWNGDAIVVMDADGEDRPEDIPKLLQALNESEHPTAVFAERGRRLESIAFRTLYECYRVMHRVLSGRDIRFGNFSLIPRSHLETLVVCPELWNHYAATFIKSRLPFVRVRCNRATRVSGRSRMDFVSLVVHGLSALFANQEVVGVRILAMITFMAASLFLLIGLVAGVRLLTELAIPGWATSTTGVLLILVSQALIASFVLVFSIMMNRSQLGFLPIRDHCYFIRCETTLYSRL